MAILIIDDEESLRRSIAAYLEDMDYDILEAPDGREGLDLLRRSGGGINAVLVDLSMPVMDGYSFIRHAVEEFPDLPVVVLSGVGVVEDALRAVRAGAWDFITKPLHNLEILDLTLNKVLERARLLRENRAYHENLEQLVRERTAELEETRRQISQRLSRAAEYKDNETGRHVIRVGQISGLLARAMGLPPERCELLGECAPLHDVGKIGIPDGVLLKPGRLSREEWEVMRQHCFYGCEILGPLDSKEAARHACANPFMIQRSAENEQLGLARVLALCHHERWDGTGYPFGLSGTDIPIEARIVTVVDVYDALCSDRPYKVAMDSAAASGLIHAGAGTQFDPDVVEAFFRHLDEINAIREKWKD